MESRDAASPGGGSTQDSSGFHLQQRVASSVGVGGGLYAPPALRPSDTNISLASTSLDGGESSPHKPINRNIWLSGNYSSLVGLGMSSASRSDSQKRKRGRPRKYPGLDGGSVSLGTSLALTTGAFVSKSPTSPAEKRGRGRPPGAGKKQHLAALGTAGSGFTPHVIAVAAGEDVANKIFAFSQQGLRALCVLSANGSISNVTMRHDSSFGGSITYEGRYEILSLSGSFHPADSNGACSRTGGLSVSLAASDGKVVGGSVSGLLVAATPVQIVVGSFVVPVGETKSSMVAFPLVAGNGESMKTLMATSIGLSPPVGSAGVAVAAVPLSIAQQSKIELSGSVDDYSEGPSSTGNHEGDNAVASHMGQFGG